MHQLKHSSSQVFCILIKPNFEFWIFLAVQCSLRPFALLSGIYKRLINPLILISILSQKGVLYRLILLTVQVYSLFHSCGLPLMILLVSNTFMLMLCLNPFLLYFINSIAFFIETISYVIRTRNFIFIDGLTCIMSSMISMTSYLIHKDPRMKILISTAKYNTKSCLNFMWIIYFQLLID